MSIPTGPSPLRGTWHGSAYDIGASSSNYGSGYLLTIEDDGTWKMSETMRGGGAAQHTGKAIVRGDRVTLVEPSGRPWLELRRSGNRLHGLASMRRSATDSGRVMIEFTRSP